MARLSIGIDVGADQIRIVAGEPDKKAGFKVRAVHVAPGPKLRGQDPADTAAALGEALADAGLKGEAVVGLTGRDVVVRYTQVPPVPDWQLRNLMNFEIQELIQQSGDRLAADFNLVPVASDMSSDDTVLLALAKETLLEAEIEAAKAAGLAIKAFAPNSIGLYNAYRRSGTEDGITLLLNIGARNTDIAVARDGDLLFARNLSGGGDLFDEALVAAFNVSREKARSLKEQFANVSPADVAKRTSQEDKVSRALSGAVGQILSMVQSSIMFARTQTGQQELKPSRVLLCGGTGLLRGLDAYLASNLGVPVSRFDPFDGVDTSAVTDELDDSARTRAAVALGLAVMAAGGDTYSIEILPAPLRKARVFKERTAWSIAAGVMVFGWLAYGAVQAKSEYDAVVADSRKLSGEYDRRNKTVKSYEEGVAEREEQARRLSMLEAEALPGIGLERALTLLQKHLPPDLFVTAVQTERVADTNLGITGSEPRPVIVVRGLGREGAEGIDAVFNRFVQELAADPLLPHTPVTSTKPASVKNAFEWTVTMNFAQQVGGAPADENAGDRS